MVSDEEVALSGELVTYKAAIDVLNTYFPVQATQPEAWRAYFEVLSVIEKRVAQVKAQIDRLEQEAN